MTALALRDFGAPIETMITARDPRTGHPCFVAKKTDIRAADTPPLRGVLRLTVTVRPSKRLNLQIARHVARELMDRGWAQTGRLPANLLGTNWVMQRWGVSVGSGLPSEKWDDSGATPPPPLDDDTAIVVDRIVQKRLAFDMNRLAVELYKFGTPLCAVAKNLDISERGMLARQNRLLIDLREHFRGVGIDA